MLYVPFHPHLFEDTTAGLPDDQALAVVKLYSTMAQRGAEMVAEDYARLSRVLGWATRKVKRVILALIDRGVLSRVTKDGRPFVTIPALVGTIVEAVSAAAKAAQKGRDRATKRWSKEAPSDAPKNINSEEFSINFSEFANSDPLNPLETLNTAHADKQIDISPLSPLSEVSGEVVDGTESALLEATSEPCTEAAEKPIPAGLIGSVLNRMTQSPRATGTNPRALGTNPRATGPAADESSLGEVEPRPAAVPVDGAADPATEAVRQAISAVATKVPEHERKAWWAPCRFEASVREQVLRVLGAAYQLEQFERRGYADELRRQTGFTIEYVPPAAPKMGR